MDDVIEHEKMVEGNLEPFGDGSVGVDELTKVSSSGMQGKEDNDKLSPGRVSQVVKPERWE